MSSRADLSARPTGHAGSAPPRPGRSAVLSVRISQELKDRMEAARLGPYKVSITDIIERGIELALAEMHAISSQSDT